MLSYRHAFHAGNASDVFKHVVLAFCLDYLAAKETAFTYIDTHAGAGFYNLEESYAAHNREWERGFGLIRKKLSAASLPPGAAGTNQGSKENALAPLAAPYLACLKSMPDSDTPCYPGSPLIAKNILRKQDKAHCFELHPSDCTALRQVLADDPRFTVQCGDGLAALKGLLPPPQRRGLIFIDPSYEIKDDYAAIPLVLEECLRRFSGGLYLLWFPLLKQGSPGAAASQNFVQKLPGLSKKRRCIISALRERTPRDQNRGLYGSGLFIINPPWTLKAALHKGLPALVSLLDGAGCRLSWEE
jgi:23S rRNA (adenine2030-N6)-methyltransferase